VSATPDFRRLFESAPGCFLVLAPDLTILAASDEYLKATMTERASLVGRPLFEAFPDNPDDPDADGVANLMASLGRVLTKKRGDRMPVQKYDIRRPASEGAGFELRYWRPNNVPVLGDDGRVAYVIHSVENVTDQVAAREKERSEEQYRQLLDTSPDAIVVVDRTGRIVLVNIETEAMFGYTRGDLIGRPLSILVPDRFRAKHGEHEARFFARPAPRPMGSRLELFAQRKDGSEFPIEVRLSPLGAGENMTVSAAIRDVTDRKRIEAESKRSAELLVSAVESIQDAFAVFDHEDRLLLCNSAYRQLIGEALPGPIVGRKYDELLDAWIDDIAFTSNDARDQFRAERLARRREPMSSFDLKMRDGRSLRVIDRRTAEGGIVKTIWDLTEDVRLAEEVRVARGAAEAASNAKSEFLSSMSHELRTPLNAILGFAQLLQRDRKEPLSDRHKERVDQIVRGGEHLLRLIDDVLDLSRIEAQGISVSIEPVHLREVLEEVHHALEPIGARVGVSVTIDPLPAETPAVAADRTRFAQILMNFGSNAIKYNRPGGSARFAVDASAAHRVRISVHDTGLGIPLEKQEKLFQPFQRAGQETGPIEGTGIGLVITQRLARMMGGDTGFSSEPGQGSTFWVELPVHVGARAVAPAAAPVTTRVTEPTFNLSGAGRRLLLYVEDNPANVSFMKDLLDTFEELEVVAVPTAELDVGSAHAPTRRRHHGHQSAGDERHRRAPRAARRARDEGHPGDRAERRGVRAGQAARRERRLLPVLDQAGEGRRAPWGARPSARRVPPPLFVAADLRGAAHPLRERAGPRRGRARPTHSGRESFVPLRARGGTRRARGPARRTTWPPRSSSFGPPRARRSSTEPPPSPTPCASP
jgi:PAS domain S-box-containing protein